MTTSRRDDLTLIIPTHNRPQFLRRLLYYYAAMNETAKFLIVDSSEPVRAAENRELIAEYSSMLNVTHRHMAEDFVTKCRIAVEEDVTTPFLAFCADDDFLLPDSLQRCLAELKSSPEFSAAQGIMVSLCTSKQNRCYALPVHNIDNNDAEARFKSLAVDWFSTFYSVYRTADACSAWQAADQFCDYQRARIFPEFFLSQMSVILGKVKYVPCVYNLREEHDLNESAVVPEVADNSAVSELYLSFRAGLQQYLSAGSVISHERAGELIDKHYGHLGNGICKSAGYRKGSKLKRLVVRELRRVLDLVKPNSVRVRRRISSGDKMCQTEFWRLAHQLMIEHPHGMTHSYAQKLRRSA